MWERVVNLTNTFTAEEIQAAILAILEDEPVSASDKRVRGVIADFLLGGVTADLQYQVKGDDLLSDDDAEVEQFRLFHGEDELVLTGADIDVTDVLAAIEADTFEVFAADISDEFAKVDDEDDEDDSDDDDEDEDDDDSDDDSDDDDDDDDEDGDDSDGGGMSKLDVGSDAPSVECASVSQTTTIDDRPVDIILVGAGDAILADYDFRWWVTDLPPAIAEAGVNDARVFVIVDGAPSEHIQSGDDPGLYEGCSDWYCGGPTSVPLDVVDAVIPADSPLQGVVQSAPQWLGMLRPEARKQIFMQAPMNDDQERTAAEFVADVTALDASFAGFTFHAMVYAPDGALSPMGQVRVASELTGGLYDDGTVDDIDDGFFDGLLTHIKESTLACEYDIPEPPEGFVFAPDEINVEYDEGTGLENIGYVSSASDCAQVGAGWHYDDETNPTKIVMCPFSCQRFAAAANATIDIQFGCATIPAG